MNIYYVVCPTCGAKNGVPSFRVELFNEGVVGAKCGDCFEILRADAGIKVQFIRKRWWMRPWFK